MDRTIKEFENKKKLEYKRDFLQCLEDDVQNKFDRNRTYSFLDDKYLAMRNEEEVKASELEAQINESYGQRSGSMLSVH